MNWTLSFCILLTCIFEVCGQESVDRKHPKSLGQARHVITEETYLGVLDLVFPRDGVQGSYGMVLRFRPSSQAESQIVVNRGNSGPQVIEYVSMSGNIYSMLNRLISKGMKEDPKSLAKLIKVERRFIPTNLQNVAKWHDSLYQSFQTSLGQVKERADVFERTGTSNVAVDGTFYDLWYGQGIDELTLHVYDEEVAAGELNGDLKIVQWMNTVRHDVQALSPKREGGLILGKP